METELECPPAFGLGQRGGQPYSGPAARDSPGGGPIFLPGLGDSQDKASWLTGLGIQVRPTSVGVLFCARCSVVTGHVFLRHTCPAHSRKSPSGKELCVFLKC